MAKKLVKGEAAFDAFVELIDPIFEVSQDEELKRLFIDEKGTLIQWLAEAIKRHKETFMRVLSLLTGQEAEDMDFTAVYRGATALFNDRGLLNLFLPRSRTSAKSGSASESTEAQDS